MSEEVKLQDRKSKQYLLMVDEIHMAILSKIVPGLLFVQVEGMAMQNNDTHMLLVTQTKNTGSVDDSVEAL